MSEGWLSFTYEGQAPQRLDQFLVACLPEHSRARLQTLIRAGHVLVDGVPAHKTGQALENGNTAAVFLPPPAPASLVAEDIPLEVLYETDDVLVVNKPAGMVVHPAAGHSRGTLANAALSHAPYIDGVGGEQRPGIVHRLDKDTSGILVVAKNDRTHRFLQEQFRSRRVEKTYVALVDGRPPTPRGRVEAAIGRDPRNRKRMAVVPDGEGRPAASEYATLRDFPRHTLLEVHPETGRTHQIRVHLAFLGCPVAGDILYGRKKSTLSIGRHFLHAGRLRILLPGEEDPRVFEAPLPPELAAQLRKVSL